MRYTRCGALLQLLLACVSKLNHSPLFVQSGAESIPAGHHRPAPHAYNGRLELGMPLVEHAYPTLQLVQTDAPGPL